MNQEDAIQAFPHVEEPTATEIAETIESAKEKYGITLSNEVAIRYFKLRKELGWYLVMDELAEKSGSISDVQAQSVQTLVKIKVGSDISLEDATRLADLAPRLASQHEKDRIAAELRAIIDQNKVA